MFRKKKSAEEPKRMGFNLRSTYTHEDHERLELAATSVATCAEELAVPSADNFVYSGETPDQHLQKGKRDFKYLTDALAQAGVSVESLCRVLEFGCSNSRLLRNFGEMAFRFPKHEYWGCDVDGNRLMWSFQHLSPPFHYFVNTTHPHLPISDNYFDLVYAYSVFTHMDENFLAWFLELRRIVRPGGYLFLTFQDENSYRTIVDAGYTSRFRDRVKMESGVLDQLISGDLEMVVWDRSRGCNSFWQRDFFLAYLGRYMEVLNITENTMGGFQTAVLLENRS